MAYSGESRKGFGSPWQFTLCLDDKDCKLLLPLMEKRLKQAEKMYEKYKDIHESGEATTQQDNLMTKFEEEMSTLQKVVMVAKEIINK